MAGLEEFVGLGVTIALTDLFSEGAEHIGEKFEELGKKAGIGKEEVEEALSGIKMGLASMGAGAALLAPFALIGDKAVETADKMERMEAAYGGLAEGGKEAFEQVQDVAEQLGAFKTTEVAEAGQRLLQMGTDAGKVAQMLEAAGNAAVVSHTSIGEMADGLARLPVILQSGADPGRLLRRYGIGVADLMAEGLKASKGKVQGSADEIMDAVVAAMNKRFAGAANSVMAGLTGQEASFERHIEDFYLHAGQGGFLALKTRILTGFNSILSELGTGALGEDIGRGAMMFYNALAPVGHALRTVAMAAADFIHNHPALVSSFVSLVGITGAVLVAVGAVLTFVGAMNVAGIAMKFMQAQAIELGTKLTEMLGVGIPGLLGLVAIAGILYEAWENNFGGMRDTITRWADSIGSLVEGVVSLFTSGDDGVGTIPLELHDKLVDNGLWPVAKAIFLWGERLLEIGRGVASGIGDAFTVVGDILSMFGSVVTFIIDLLGEMIGVVLDASHALGFLTETSQTSLTVAKVLGEIIGIGIGIFLTYQGVVMAASLATKAWTFATTIATTVTEGYAAAVALWESGTISATVIQWGWAAAVGAYNVVSGIARGATVAWTAVQWALNAAMTANPLGVIIAGVVLLVGAVATAIAYIDELRESFENMLDIKPMRWLMQKAGIIPEGASDKDIDAAMGSREAEGNRRQARRGELGRDDFFSRIADNASGVDYANDDDYASALARDTAPASRYVTGGNDVQPQAMTQDEMREAIASGMSRGRFVINLDGKAVYDNMVEREFGAADRRGDQP